MRYGGDYALVRPWDEKKFLTSLHKPEETPVADLKLDGNRAVIYCSTTDAYQTLKASTGVHAFVRAVRRSRRLA